MTIHPLCKYWGVQITIIKDEILHLLCGLGTSLSSFQTTPNTRIHYNVESCSQRDSVCCKYESKVKFRDDTNALGHRQAELLAKFW